MVTAKKHSRWTMPLVAAVFLLATVVQLLTPTLAYADTASDMHDKNYKHYAATYLRDCLYHLPNETKNTVLQARANDPTRFFASSWKVGIGLYMEADDGLAGCEEGGLVQTALESLGYAGNPGKLLTDIGYTVDKTELGCNVQNAACEDGKQNRYTRPSGGDTFNTFFARALSPVPGEARYVAYQKIFASKCSLVEPPTGSGSAVTYKKVVLKDGKYEVQDTKAEFPIEDKGTYNGKKVTHDIGVTPIKNYEYEGKNTTCRDLRAEMDGLAEAVKEYNNQHKDDPIVDGMLDGGTDECNEKSATWNAETKSCGKDEPTCTDQIKGIGWLICPTMEFLAEINDYAYGFLASNFLQTDTSLVKGAEAPWARFKDLANIAFVIALLFVIYSQITSIGISNYGIKKMLPKIIVAALLVNLSYIICQVAVDLSNILGYGISRFFTGIPIGSGMDTASDEGMKALGLTLNWTGAIGAILVAGVGLAMALSFPVVLSALLAIAMIALILIARKALIVLLIVVAPLAFVAYLLPNTEQWFKKWFKLFSTLLLLFPIVGVVFGASALAAKIVATAAGAAGDVLMQLTALAISALPFFVVPGLLKGALNAAGAFGAKMQGWANKAGSGVGSAVKSRSQLGATYQAAQKHREQRQLSALAKRRGKGLNRVVGRVVGGKDYNAKARLRASDLEASEFEDDVKSATNSFNPEDHKDIISIAKSGKKLDGTAVSEAEQVAAIRYAAKSGSASDVAQIDTVGKSARVRSATVDAFKEKKLNNVVGNQVLTKIAEDGTNGAMIDDMVVDAMNKGTIAASTVAQSDSTPEFIAKSVGRQKTNANSKVTATRDGYRNLQKAVDQAYSTPATKAAMTEKMGADLRGMGLTTP